MGIKQKKLEELVKNLAAQFIQIESSGVSLITITRCIVSEDLKHAKILVTVLPEQEEERAMEFLKRKRSEARSYIATHARTRVVPVVDFALDIGEKTRQKIDDISRTP